MKKMTTVILFCEIALSSGVGYQAWGMSINESDRRLNNVQRFVSSGDVHTLGLLKEALSKNCTQRVDKTACEIESVDSARIYVKQLEVVPTGLMERLDDLEGAYRGGFFDAFRALAIKNDIFSLIHKRAGNVSTRSHDGAAVDDEASLELSH